MSKVLYIRPQDVEVIKVVLRREIGECAADGEHEVAALLCEYLAVLNDQEET